MLNDFCHAEALLNGAADKEGQAAQGQPPVHPGRRLLPLQAKRGRTIPITASKTCGEPLRVTRLGLTVRLGTVTGLRGGSQLCSSLFVIY